MKQRALKHAFLILVILTLAGQVHAQNIPLTYQAVIDRDPRAKPALPVLGAAGSIITDPTFGSRILREQTQIQSGITSIVPTQALRQLSRTFLIVTAQSFMC